MCLALDDTLTAHNPATGAEIGRVPMTSPDDVAAIVARSREAQARTVGVDLASDGDRGAGPSPSRRCAR